MQDNKSREKIKEKKKLSFPTAFTVLFIILFLASILTYTVPAGSFERLQYDPETSQFTKIGIDGSESKLEANEEVLQEHNISIPLQNFKDGKVLKPVAIPGTYQKLEQRSQNFIEVLKAPIQGVAESIGIITFVLILGGIIEVLNKTGAFAAGVAALSKRTKGREFLLVTIIMSLVSLGGTTFGFAEETIAFYPILMPIFLASGFDALVCISGIFLGSAIGTMFSTVNPFSVVIASNAAGISLAESLPYKIIGLIGATLIALVYVYRYAKRVKEDPNNSLVAEEMPAIREKFLENYNVDEVHTFNWRKSISLVIFALAFLVMIWGVVVHGWMFEEMSALFLFVALLIMILSGLSEKEVVGTFLTGASSLVSVALIIGVARGINIILDNGMVSDTFLNGSSVIISKMNGFAFAVVQMILYSFLGIFIPSSSGLASLSMPIIAPLADVVNVGRDVVVSAYNYGQGLMAFITPTGLILATLELVGISYDKWLKFVLPLMIIIGIFAIIMLGIQVAF
ncbi:YfcC family protein [Facklamia sp. DSM 111018]|uniref:YfcC family protein n=2 Tax=Facklamia lactis TaxID=2749967 RepID=A0ABS0LQ79_9LACT|nr:YfcC family protein [Facklamia lactis]MBG9986315.1 YfcC family protein [Facklamia lactis]